MDGSRETNNEYVSRDEYCEEKQDTAGLVCLVLKTRPLIKAQMVTVPKEY